MTQAEFRAWRKRMNLTQAQAASALGLCTTTICYYETGRRGKRDGRAVVIPKVVELATVALATRAKLAIINL